MLMGKNIVVTGAASGIGKRTAELAQAMGANVFSVDRNTPDNPVGHFIAADLGSADGVAALIAQLPNGIDALANVAGLSGTPGAVPTIAVNFLGLRALSLGLAPKMNQYGSVINVASIAGFGWRGNAEKTKAAVAVEGFPDPAKFCADHGVTDEISYPTSKEFLLMWTYQAAQNPVFKDRNIRVNAVSPGPVETPILKQFRDVLGDERVDSDIDRVGRAGTANDIAPSILFLASDGARWVNGTNIACDGGLEASILAEVMDF
ncbi:2,5-dichloro-2,5-cyclohexadiene-1,4-diol dehydrogenase [Thalassovita gelatinovora]|uniref:2,5-dichloro-2,5-cyclohexadiene-1,4-diol dehydrogenase n=1 Tax=Thalassovita gelatinovora TaxID=53501 RepID=A0A0P1FQZ8_THAGE|nr:coniferyl-alcohol dehydrogenase [Thalassovita gelatinovora]QIZ80901.1 coniferyl-alcohol dehydrogenase [Thalassovita gelatinovora]CUH63382.1 2,5-dichloro-2,5-cyclohexadiene-1,4-diol dehydrogenase [Thalassovita gelatinovora]SEQ66108.1 NAD(P)-dependent dehydrogenase, short-chain alcohol dehydrogenase family [Thalassovita gelatinovora]